MSTTLDRPNRYAAHCIRCSAKIAAGKGLLALDDDGHWAADHPGDCPEKPTVYATPVVKVDRDGIYRDDHGTEWIVRATPRGQLYAEDEHGRHHPGIIHTLRDDQRVADL